MRRATSTSTSVGANTRFAASMVFGWISVLPSKPRERPWAHAVDRPSASSRSRWTPSSAALPCARAARTINERAGSRAWRCCQPPSHLQEPAGLVVAYQGAGTLLQRSSQSSPPKVGSQIRGAGDEAIHVWHCREAFRPQHSEGCLDHTPNSWSLRAAGYLSEEC